MSLQTLGICAIVRDEGPYLAEWLAFHRLLGVSRFTLYDDRSTDDTLEVIARHDRGDICVHRYVEGWHRGEFCGLDTEVSNWWRTPQCCAFTHYGRTHARETFWTAFIDVDEFLFHATLDNLPAALESFEEECGLVINWSIFGSNGHATRPPGLTIESYTRRAICGDPQPWGRHVKTIVRMDATHQWGPHGSHTPVFPHRLQVSQDGRANPWSMTPAFVAGPLQLNHYYHRSAEEAARKAVKDDRNAPPGYPNAARVAAHDRNEVLDETILRFVPRVKEGLGIRD